jgi:RNA polymerase sigma-70 factor (ECF subfamily)
MDEDLELIDKIIGGDKAAYKTLVDKHKKRVYSVAYGIIGDREEAKDILQEAFMKAFYSIGSFRRESSFYSWLYRILVNLCKDYIRKKSKAPSLIRARINDDYREPEEIEIVDTGKNPKEELLNKEITNVVGKALKRLPPKQRLIFILRHINGFSMEEISDSLRCSRSTCKVHLFRAIRALRKELDYYK